MRLKLALSLLNPCYQESFNCLIFKVSTDLSIFLFVIEILLITNSANS